MKRAEPGRRGGRWLRRFARALGWLVIGTVVVLIGVAAAINLPWARARVARELSQRISASIAGSLEVTHIGHIGFGTVEGMAAVLSDPSGRGVAELEGGSADLDVSLVVRSWLEADPLVLAFERIAAARLDVELIEDESGQLSIARAVEPSAPRAAEPAPNQGQPLSWSVEEVAVEGARVQYAAADGTEIDVRLQELTGSAYEDAGALGFELRRVALRAASVPVAGEVEATLSASGTLELGARNGGLQDLMLEVRVRGAAAEIPFEARAFHADGKLMGYVDVNAAPRSLERLWPAAAVGDSVQLYLGFEGDIDRIQLLCVLESIGGAVYARGHVGLSPQLSGELSLVALRVDASDWIAGAPETSVQLAAELRFTAEAGNVEGRAAARTWNSQYGALELPDLALSARVDADALEAKLRFEMPGGRAELRADMPVTASDDAHRRLNLELSANITDLERLARTLGTGASLAGRGQLEGAGTIELGGDELRITEARLTAAARDLSVGALDVSQIDLTATARGAAGSPELELSARARNVAIPSYPLQSMQVSARGDFARARVRVQIDPARGEPMQISASIAPAAKTLRGLTLVTAQDSTGSRVEVSAERLTLTESGLELRDLVVLGPGRLELDGSIVGERVVAEGRAERFSAAVLARRLGLGINVPEGVADLELSADYRPRHVTGVLRGTITEIAVAGTIGRIAADLSVNDNVADGVVDVCFPSLTDVRLEATSLELPARPSLAALRRMSGTLESHLRADLGQLAKLPVLTRLPLPTGGELQVHAIVEGDAQSFPEVRVAVATHELAWPLPSFAAFGIAESEPARRAVNLELTASVASSGLRVAADLLGAHGESLAALSGRARVDAEQLWTRPQTIDLRELPVELELNVAERALQELPLPARFERIRGRASARLIASGTLGRPAVSARLSLTGLNLEKSRQAPLDVTADATLAGDRLHAEAFVRSDEQKLLSLRADAQVSGGGRRPRIEGLDLDLRSNGLPLAPFGAFADLDLSGDLYGSLQVENLATAPELHGTLWVNRPELEGFRQKQARWTVAADGSAFSTRLELRQGRSRAEISAAGPWIWSELSAPVLQPRLVRGSLMADGFALAGLQALMPEQVRSLGGQLDAALFIEPADAGKSRGYLRLRDGAAYVAALGQEFRGVRLDATLDGGGRVEIGSLRARALQGRLSGRGHAQLDGFAFRAAELAVEIPRGDPMPLMLEGVNMADAWGNLELRARLEPGGESRRLNIEVDVPRLQISLPRQAPPDVQELEANPTIVTGTYQQGGHFITLPLPPYDARDGERTGAAAPPLGIRIELALGDRVWLERGTQLEAKLGGSVVFEVRDELAASGELRIERGQIDVQGRIFEIENGVITFVEAREPSNPTVVATARYTAPEGTRVYAEFIGPVETGRLSLRSEPPLRDDQILSLLLFGTTDGNFGSASGEESSMSGVALAAGGSVVTSGLNQELRRLTTLDIQTRIGEREGAPQPEVAVQISPRVTAELAYSLSAPTPGRAQDRTYLTLDLRLFRNWSLSTTIGDAGSLLLDLLWRLRY